VAKLYFRYGAMGASKTANALMVEYNYIERNQIALLFKPSVDNRSGANIVKSRIGISKPARLIFDDTDIFKVVKSEVAKNIKINCIIIDEVQFLNKENIFQLSEIVDKLKIPVIAFGLRTDFRGELFEGSKWLFALADSIEEIKTVCFCGKKAIMNARIVEGKVIKTGEQIKIGGNEAYIALCRKHWKEGETGE